jgi:hypothetical protein
MHLVRRLGEVECRDCGDVREPSAAPASVTPISGAAAAPGGAAGGAGGSSVGGDTDFGETPGLAEEVELALARVLGRGKPARIG